MGDKRIKSSHDTPGFSLRAGRISDLDAVTDISNAIRSLESDPPYRYPLADKYPEDYAYYTKLRNAEFLENIERGAYDGIVAEVPDESEGSGTRVVAFSLWWFLAESKSRPPALLPKNHPERRDADLERIKVFVKTIQDANRDWFEPRYGDQQVVLLAMSVHPDFQRRGIASAVVRWGMDKAAEQKAAVTLFATEVGAHLYSKMGFRDAGIRYAQVEGQEEKDLLRGMEWNEAFSKQTPQHS